jgi:large subunit ribosomal protein L4
MKLDVYDIERRKVGEIDLDDAVFGGEVREHLLYAAVRYQRAKARAGTHQSKRRAGVRGGGKKPWRQKGTGRARQGSSRSPHWKGGGTVFGPVTRSHAFKLNKKVRALALMSALARRAQDKAIVVVDGFALDAPKTKRVAEFMERFTLGEMTLVAPRDEVLEKSARNLQKVTVLPPEGLNVYDVLRHRHLVLTKAAVEAVTTRLRAG